MFMITKYRVFSNLSYNWQSYYSVLNCSASLPVSAESKNAAGWDSMRCQRSYFDKELFLNAGSIVPIPFITRMLFSKAPMSIDDIFGTTVYWTLKFTQGTERP